MLEGYFGFIYYISLSKPHFNHLFVAYLKTDFLSGIALISVNGKYFCLLHFFITHVLHQLIPKPEAWLYVVFLRHVASLTSVQMLIEFVYS